MPNDLFEKEPWRFDTVRLIQRASGHSPAENTHIDLRQWKKGHWRNLREDLLLDELREGVVIKLKRYGKHQPIELKRTLRKTYHLPRVAAAIQHVEGKARTFKLTIPYGQISFESPRT